MKTLTQRNNVTTKDTLGCIAVIAILLAQQSSSLAQTYVGDAYGAGIDIAADLVVEANARIADNPTLPSGGSVDPLTFTLASADARADTGTLIPSTFCVITTNSGAANAFQTSTVGFNSVATSSSQVLNATVIPNTILDFSLPLALPILSGLTTDSLVQASLIRSTTTANAFGNSGRTEILGLSFGSTSLGNFDISSGVSTTYYLNVLGNVSLTPNAVLNVADVAALVINNQFTTDNGTTRTTEAIALRVLSANQPASGSVVIASSTAGFAAVVPESGTMALFGVAGLLMAGPAVVRYRRTKATSV